MGTSFAAVTRIFAKQSVKFCLFLFTIKTKKSNDKWLGIAKGKLSLPDDFDGCNDEIKNMFSLAHVRSLKDCEQSYVIVV